jgi:hypothetical protein
LFLNSIGFGYCDDVSAVFGSLAKSAGYSARGWSLDGHVVAEIQDDVRWEMYDPDLAVYYNDRADEVAGVEQLSADPSLITSPVAAVSSWSWPYSQPVADLYASTSDNTLIPDDEFFVEANPAGPLELPPRGRITYPGSWTPGPISVYGGTPPASAQLRLDLPAGFTGTVDWPLVAWDVQGSGRVQIGGVEYAAGSAELLAALHSVISLPYLATPPRSVQVIEATGSLAIIFLANPLRFSLAPRTNVSLRSVDAWALDVQLAQEPPDSWVDYDDTSALVRPR